MIVKRSCCICFLISFNILFLLSLCFHSIVRAEKWNDAYIRALPDSAFAVIEYDQHEKRYRRLPYHSIDGEIDIPHLLSALGRIHQVKWLDPRSKEIAHQHLLLHYAEYNKRKNAK